MTDRLHAFEAIDNFRDFGDYATTAGRRVQPGRLLRSAHHARASDADLERLRLLDIGAVATEAAVAPEAAARGAGPDEAGGSPHTSQ